MKEILYNIDWTQVFDTLWTIVLLPVLTFIGTQVGGYFKSKKLDKYQQILYNAVLNAVKDVYQTTVEEIKGTDEWTDEKKAAVKDVAKVKAIQALSNAAYKALQEANSDFESYLDGLVETALYDCKNK
jgi:hypothetical protein